MIIGNPIMQRENPFRVLRRMPVRAWLFVFGLCSIPIVFAVILWNFGIEPLPAIRLLIILAPIGAILPSVIALAFSSGAISSEYEHRTWDSLVISPLSSWVIVIGKYLSRIPYVLLPILFFAPLLAVLLKACHGGNFITHALYDDGGVLGSFELPFVMDTWVWGVAPWILGLALGVGNLAIGLFISSKSRRTLTSVAITGIAISVPLGLMYILEQSIDHSRSLTRHYLFRYTWYSVAYNYLTDEGPNLLQIMLEEEPFTGVDTIIFIIMFLWGIILPATFLALLIRGIKRQRVNVV